LSIQDLHSQDFSACLNSTFHVEAPDGAILPLQLVGVIEHALSPRTEHFTLSFVGPLTPILPQAIHKMKHDKLGEFSLFVVALGPEGDAMTYEVIFNRLRPKTAESASPKQ